MEVGDGGALAEELRVVCEPYILAAALPGRLLERGPHEQSVVPGSSVLRTTTVCRSSRPFSARPMSRATSST